MYGSLIEMWTHFRQRRISGFIYYRYLMRLAKPGTRLWTWVYVIKIEVIKVVWEISLLTFAPREGTEREALLFWFQKVNIIAQIVSILKEEFYFLAHCVLACNQALLNVYLISFDKYKLFSDNCEH